MSKGKKFDAAEKHFMKKEGVLRREIKELRAALNDARQDLENCLAAKNRLVAENAALKQERDRLLALQGLSQDEIRQLIQDEHKKAESFGTISALCKLGKGSLSAYS